MATRLPKIGILTPSQGRSLLDRRAKAELKISGKQFVRDWKAGKFARRACSPEVMRVAMLLPLAK
jgi:hypothetical protein